jgi:5'-nucleotidase/UDP-sugar diphosphatase
MSFVTPSRRRLLQLAGAAVLTPGLTAARRRPVIGRVLAVSDMHSAYERTGRLLAAFEREVKSQAVPHVIAINGDIFEHGNAVSVRSGGAVDWAFLAEAARLAPTVVNLGNHDNDLTPDLAEVVARMRSLGVLVVSNIVDTRTGATYAAASTTAPFGSRRLRIVGLATNALNTYPQASRAQLSIPAPGEWASAHLADLTQSADPVLVLSHAGVVADRTILPLLPDGALMIGGHDHLLFQHTQGRSAYAHTGSWTNAYTVADFHEDGSVTAESRAVMADAPSWPPLQDLIDATFAAHLTDEDRVVLGRRVQPLSLGDTGRRIAAGFAQAADADAGFIGHTTLGTGAPSGPITRHMFDSIVRFDGRLMAADVSFAQLEGFMARANQDRPIPLDQRTGDFLYGATRRPATDSRVQTGVARIVTTDWCAINQGEYFGTTTLRFAEIPDRRVKAVAASALFEA